MEPERRVGKELSGSWRRQLSSKKTVILDADGLNLLSVHDNWKCFIGEHVILTPHIGEMSRL